MLVRIAMYDCKRVLWLALFLGTHLTKLDYKRVRRAGAMRLMMGVWNVSLHRPHDVASCIQKKTERFLGTSNLASQRKFVVKVPAKSEHAVVETKRIIAKITSVFRKRFNWFF